MNKAIRGIISILIATIISTSIYAQVTTASISGHIKDSYTSVSGVAIIATNSATGVRYYAFTDNSGRFRINNIVPGGPYSIKVQMLGYNTIKAENIYIPLGENYVINEDLQEAAFDVKADVIVTKPEDYGIMSNKAGDMESMTTSYSETIPALHHNLNDILGTYSRTFISDGYAYIGGGDNTLSNLAIDGTSYSNYYGIGSNYPSIGSGISPEAIEQISLSVSPFDIRQGGFTGGSVNLLTRSGSNHWTASAYSYFNDKSSNPLNLLYGATIGGPIMRNKLFFFGNFEMGTSPETGAYQGISALNPGMKFLGRLDWNITNNHSFNISYINSQSQPQSSSSKHSISAITAALNSRFLEGKLTNILRGSYLHLSDATSAGISTEISYNSGFNNIVAALQYRHLSFGSNVFNQFSAYLQDELALSRRFNMTAGIRYDSSLLSPRLGYNWDIFGSRKVILRGGTGIFTSYNPLISVPQIWKSSIAFDFALPYKMEGSIDAQYGKDVKGSGYYYSAGATLEKHFSNGFALKASYIFNNARVDNNGSDISIEHQVLGYDGYVMPHRVVASASYRVEYARHFATAISVFYYGGPQGRFTYTYTGDEEGNILFIPQSIREMTFSDYTYQDPNGAMTLYSAEQQKDDFWAYVAQDKYLSTHKGQSAEKNGVVYPWANHIDLRIAQDFYLGVNGKRHTLRVGLNFINIANLLNPEWGGTYYYHKSDILSLIDPINPQNGDSVYQFATNGSSPLSQTWGKSSVSSIQLSLRYIFN